MFLQRSGQRCTIAERFFLREGAMHPAASGGVRVRHVEDTRVSVICGGRGAEGEGGVDAVGIDHSDPCSGEVGTVSAVEDGRIAGFVEVASIRDIGSRCKETREEGSRLRCDVFQWYTPGITAFGWVGERFASR